MADMEPPLPRAGFHDSWRLDPDHTWKERRYRAGCRNPASAEMSVMSSPKPQLIPVTVPWMIDASTPYLRLEAAEGEEAVLRFAAQFRVRHDGEPAGGSDSVKVVDSPYASAPSRAAAPDAPYRLVRATFRPGGAWARLAPAHSGRSPPDPRMYEVQDSEWLAGLGRAARGLKHFIALGHDVVAEVLASTWSWEVERSLDRW